MSYSSLKKLKKQFDEEADELIKEIQSEKKSYSNKLEELSKKTRIAKTINSKEINEFLDEPYVVVPAKQKETWFVAVPKFVKMNLGWLDYSTETYNVFKINKFMHWIGDIPKDIQHKFKFNDPLPLKVFDGMVLTGREHQEATWNRYKNHLQQRKDKDKIKIKRGHEFKLLAQLIDDGMLPFIPQPIEKQDLRKGNLKFELRDYQRTAWQKLRDTGATGVFWAYGAGKTFLALHALEHVRVGDRPNFVTVPTTTLKEQWKKRIVELTENAKNDFLEEKLQILTYQSFHKLQNKKWGIGVMDEAHHLPANTYSRFATIDMKYRLGLSGSPHREDGRTEYIFALTGFPVGLSWDNLIELGVLEVPDIRVYLFSNWNEKTDKLEELLAQDKKTIVFCDGIQKGKNLSKRFEIPFVSGETKNRIETIESADKCIVSRVGDEGLSLPDIERVVEIDFQFGSRRQEGQRLGRLFHSEERGEHVILMTETEFKDYGKRLKAIQERGFKLELIR